MADEDVGTAIARRVESEIKSIREKAELEMTERLRQVEKEFEKNYRSRIFIALAAIAALLVAGAMTSTSKATRMANEAVIQFQNVMIERQKSFMQTEETVTLLLNKVTDATSKVSKAEADLAIATTRLKDAEESLRLVEGKMTEEEKNIRATAKDLEQKRHEYEGFAARLQRGK